MSWALDQFFVRLEEEFDVPVADADRRYLGTPGEVIDFLLEHSSVAGGLSAEARRDEIAAAVGELMAESLGVTRYREDSRFVEDLRVG